MRLFKFLVAVFSMMFIFSGVSLAGDFDWMKDFKLKAEADPSGFKASLCTRFKIGDAEVDAVLSNVNNSADAYMVLRLGEMSGRPTNDIIKRYKSGKGQGWGALAKSLGIKPGSKEFKDLKNSDDLYNKSVNNSDKGEKTKKKKK